MFLSRAQFKFSEALLKATPLPLLAQSAQHQITFNYFRFSRGDGPSDLECSYSSSLPLQEFFNEIDSYFMKRKQYKSSLEILTQRMAQFRSIERRLLTRFKDKTPSALTNLDMLLEGTYKQVQASCDQVEAATKEEQMVGSNLSCIIR